MGVLAAFVGAMSGYDGIDPHEWNQMSFFERVKVYDWTKELFILATLLIYVGFYFWGVRSNKGRVNSWMRSVEPVLRTEFAAVGCEPQEGGRKIIRDSASRYTTYASGRVNIEALLARFHAVDRHNVILNIGGLVIPALRSVDGLEDEVVVEIVPTNPKAIEPFVFAVVSKLDLQRVRDDNWFLKYTRLVESSKLSPDVVLMHEHTDTVGLALTPELQAAINDGPDLLVSFAVTDQPRGEPKKPASLVSRPRILLTTRYPQNAEQEAILGRLVAAAVHLVDSLVDNKHPLSSSVVRKIKTARDSEVAQLLKAEEDEKREETERKKAEARREELKKLSDKEQRKLAKKEQDKLAKKQRKMTSRRV